MRRFLIILSIIIVLAGIALAVYFFYFRTAPGVVVTHPGQIGLPGAGNVPPTGSTTPGTGTTTTPNPPITGPAAPVARLNKISAGPVVPGMVVVDTRVGTTSSPSVMVNYIERQSGNVYTYSPQTGTHTRISNKTIPGIQSAAWFPSGATAIVRYLSGTDFSTINTYSLSANGVGGSFLNQGIADISVSSSSVLELVSGSNGSSASLARPDGTGATPVFTTPLSSLRASFAGKGQYLAFTKPAADLPGTAYLVDSAGHFSRIAGPLNGLVALASPSGKWALISYTVNNTLAMELVAASSNEVIALPIATIADKCVWAADESAAYCGIPQSPQTNAKYPDDWYQGAVTFTDQIWKINIAGDHYARLVLDFTKETTLSLDATALTLDPSNTLLAFVNKIDGSLWSFSL